MSKQKILVYGTGFVALHIIKAFAKLDVQIGLITTKLNDTAGTSKHLSNVFIAPYPLGNEKELLLFFENLAIDWQDAIIQPANDPYVEFLAKNHAKLSQFYTLATPAWELQSGIVEKNRLYESAERLNVPSPKILDPQSDEELESVLGEIKYPVILKPHQSPEFFSQYGEKVHYIENQQSLLDKSNQCKKDNLDVMISEIIPGDESKIIVYYSYLHDGKILAEMQARKIRQHPPAFGVASAIFTEQISDDARQYTYALLSDANYSGFSAAEYKFDERDKKYKLIEINTRPILSFNLLTKAGINFAEITLHALTNTLSNNAIKNEYTKNYYWLHNEYETRKLGGALFGKDLSFSAFISPYLKKHTMLAISPFDDPKPFINISLRIIKNILFSIKKRLF